MKLPTVALIFTATAGLLLAVETGDTYEKVVGEKGSPSTKMEMGDVTLMKYPDMTIKLKEGIVVSVKPEKQGAASGPTVPATVAPGAWTTDYPGALKQAKAGNKKVLLLFTGSDWCGWCKKLEREILATGEFKAYASQNLVLVKLDFPQRIPQSAQLVAANRKLAQQYGIDGYPTVILLNSEGRNIGQLGYMEGGPSAFINEIKRL